MKDKISMALTWAFMTNFGRLLTCIGLAAISLFIANWCDFMVWVALGFFVIFPLPFFFVELAYAFVINPISDYKKSKRDKANLIIFNAWKAKMVGKGCVADELEYDRLCNIYLEYPDKLGDINQYNTPAELDNAITKV